MARAEKRPVVLHLDLNRTVLMSDAAAGRDVRDTLNYIVADSVWGRTTSGEDGKAHEWSPASDRVQDSAPEEGLDSYLDYLSARFRYASSEQDVPESFSGGVVEYNKSQRAHKRRLEKSFSHLDQPGYAFTSEIDRLEAALKLSQEELAAVAPKLDALPEGALKDSWRRGMYYLLPSFWRLFRRVAALRHEGRDVRIVFRTFGADLPDVMTEVNLFCGGEHPLEPLSAPLDGTGEGPDMRLRPPFAHFFRGGASPNDMLMVWGTLEEAPFRLAPAEVEEAPDKVVAAAARLGISPLQQPVCKPVQEAICHYAERADEGVHAVQGDWACAKSLWEAIAARPVCGVSDCYYWWNGNGEVAHAGKFLPLPAPSDATVPFHALFDDHIHRDDAFIVDARHMPGGNTMPFGEAQDVVLYRVDPRAAVLDPDFFTDKLTRVLDCADSAAASAL